MSCCYLLAFFFTVAFLVIVESFVLQSNDTTFYNTEDLIPATYIKEIRPRTNTGEPLEVRFSMTITDINAINVENMDFDMNVIMRQEWQDNRITIPKEIFENDEFVTLPDKLIRKLWQPDLYFLNANAEVLETLTQRFSSITLSRNKTLKYTARMRIRIFCQMEFQQYPVDIQECPINLESLAFNNKNIILKWLKAGIVLIEGIILFQYNILPLVLTEKMNIVQIKRLVATFKFKRQIGHQLIHTFAPSTLVVVLSWFSFWLDLDAIPARVTLLVTSMLTLITMFTDLGVEIPAVAYIKALDIWMAGCVISVLVLWPSLSLLKVLFMKYKELKEIESSFTKISALSNWPQLASSRNIQPQKKVSYTLISLYWINDKGEEKLCGRRLIRYRG